MPELTEAEQAAADAILGVEETGEVEQEVPPTSEEEPQAVAEVDDEDLGKTVPVKAVIEERKKRQELEAQLQAVQQRQDEMLRAIQANQPVTPPKDVYEAYDRDPQGVVRDLNAEIKRLVAEDPYGQADKIEGLRDLKDELRRREVSNITQTLSQQTQAQQVLGAIHQAIPDFANRFQPLCKFACDELGYDPQELAQAVDVRRGEAAVREWKRIDKMFQKMNATPTTKEARPRATPVEPAGRGIPKSQPNHNAIFERAKQTGSTQDWAAYLEAKGLA